MLEPVLTSPYFYMAIALVFFGLTFSIAGVVSLIRLHIGSFIIRMLLGLLIITSGLLAGSVAWGILGYQALTHEEVAAQISVTPISPQRFTALLKYPNGQIKSFIISGDEIYVDAHILKWQPIANLIGLHTVYELDRIGGRYHDIEQEKSASRTLFSLSEEKPIDLFNLRQRYSILAILFDAKYGSATFIPVTQAADFELRVSSTGLLLREVLISN